MKFSESWLREWVNPKLDVEKLSHLLTMSGLEVESITPAVERFDGVVIGKILQVEKHQKKNLSICTVDIGGKKNALQIVTGAVNVFPSAKVAVAKVNANLAKNKSIPSKLIGDVKSEGMLCSAAELGLSENSEGILILPEESPLGELLWDYLELTDNILDISITPNRGDCLSVRGLTREIAILTRTSQKVFKIPDVKPKFKKSISITVDAKDSCPRYIGLSIHNVKVNVDTPFWLKERLRRSGIRSINSIVDVINYVMLELGQPMHAFDFDTIKEEIRVRLAKKGERITLLDGSLKELTQETLVIADAKNPLAIAGVMGGLDSSVTLTTTNIFLESAFFSPQIVARQRQYFALNSDSAYRFERGIDPAIQMEALKRATQLILEISGGEPGLIKEKAYRKFLPTSRKVKLDKKQINLVLGIDISVKQIEKILHRLKFSYKKGGNTRSAQDEWIVNVPSYRLDISLPEDLIEEIARLYGYNKIPIHQVKACLPTQKVIINETRFQPLREAFKYQDYYEIISYSFIDKKVHKLLNTEHQPIELLNPITTDMAVMRTNLWPGLLNTLLYNKSRQQHRVRIFEIGTCFKFKAGKIFEEPKLAGLITGTAIPEQWGIKSREVDFYDLKNNIENALELYYHKNDIIFQQSKDLILHPGQSADIYYLNQRIGKLGALHPSILQALDLTTKIFVFELALAKMTSISLPSSYDISKFPEIRRDLAILVNQAIPSKEIQDTIKSCASDWLKDIFIFDIYQGKGIGAHLKSVALSLILQHPSRTLNDPEVADLMERIIAALKEQLGAELRS